MAEDLKLDLIKLFVKHGITPATTLRNEQIKNHYRELKNSGVKCKEAFQVLIDKYDGLTKSNLNKILYYQSRKINYPPK